MLEDIKTGWGRMLAHPRAAIPLGLVGFFAYTMMDAGGQVLMLRGMPSGEVVLARCGINLLLCFGYYLYTDHRTLRPLFVPSTNTALFWARGFAGSTALSCGYAALSYLALSEFLTALHLNPFPTALLCYLCLGEKSSKRQIIASVISFGGVLLVLQPEFLFHNQPIAIGVIPERAAGGRTIGMILTLSCMALCATEYTLYRKLGNTYDAPAMLFAYVFGGTVVSVPWILISGDGFMSSVSLSTAGVMLFITACGMTAQICIILAVKRTTGTSMAVMGYFQIIFAAIIQMVVFRQPPNLVELGGMAIIMVAGIWCMLGKSQENDEKSDIAYIALPLSASSETRGEEDRPVQSRNVNLPQSPYRDV